MTGVFLLGWCNIPPGVRETYATQRENIQFFKEELEYFLKNVIQGVSQGFPRFYGGDGLVLRAP